MLESSRTLKSVRTNATLNYSKLLDIDGSLDAIATLFGRMLLTDERLDSRQGCPDGILGFDFFELESAQNLPRTSEIAFFMFVTLNLL
jgi:hypothetical protein